MIPAYTKYEYFNRVVVPGAFFSWACAHLVSPNMSIWDKALIGVLTCIPSGFFLDITRDWIGFGLERLSKKIKATEFMLKELRKIFKEFFYYLERKYKVSNDEAVRINFKFLFHLSDQQRYYLSVRQAWASFTLNMFTAGIFLNVLNGIYSIVHRRFNFATTLFFAFAVVFFYYAGLYRLASITKTYNLLLDEYYHEYVSTKGES